MRSEIPGGLLLRSKAKELIGVVSQGVEGSVGTEFQLANAAIALEEGFLFDDLAAFDNEAADFLVLESAEQEVVFPLRKAGAADEGDGAGGDGGHPVVNRGSHTRVLGLFGNDGSIMILAVGRDGPSVIEAGPSPHSARRRP